MAAIAQAEPRNVRADPTGSVLAWPSCPPPPGPKTGLARTTCRRWIRPGEVGPGRADALLPDEAENDRVIGQLLPAGRLCVSSLRRQLQPTVRTGRRDTTI